jgi:hypothetical protein
VQHLRAGAELQDMALADRVGYHVNVYWEKAPDYRTSRTLDWLNDACEAKLEKEDRTQDKVEYTALMSPISMAFSFRDASLSLDWKHLFTPANRARLRLGKRQYAGKFPISLLLTTGLNTTHDGSPRKVPPYMLLGTKKWPGRRAAVSRFELAHVSCGQVRPVADHFQCFLRITAVGNLEVRFVTKSEAQLLSKWLEPKRNSLRRRAILK